MSQTEIHLCFQRLRKSREWSPCGELLTHISAWLDVSWESHLCCLVLILSCFLLRTGKWSVWSLWLGKLRKFRRSLKRREAKRKPRLETLFGSKLRWAKVIHQPFTWDDSQRRIAEQKSSCSTLRDWLKNSVDSWKPSQLRHRKTIKRSSKQKWRWLQGMEQWI